MVDKPLLSIVIANYNYGRFLSAAIESVLSQSCQNFEIIVIDGGSSDNSVDVIRKYAGDEVGGRRLEVEQRNCQLNAETRIPRPKGVAQRALCGVRRRAEEKVEEWLAGVDETTFAVALEQLVAEKAAAGEYVFSDEGEREAAIVWAKKFFTEFSHKLIKLSDGRYVYFVPDTRARDRGVDNSRAWAEYAFHAVSTGGKQVPGKAYFIRHYSDVKCENLSRVEMTIRAEQCVPVIERDRPDRDAVHFVGTSTREKRFDIVTRLDEYGNVNANLSEVTVVMTKKKYTEKNPPPVFRPLTEVVEAVAKHQAAGFSPSTTANNIANSSDSRKGEGEKVKGEGQERNDQIHSSTSPSNFDSKITYWVSEPDKGQSDAFNKGFAKAKGRFLTWLNADDVMLPGTIEKLRIAAEKHPGQEWFVGGCFWLDKEMRVIQCRKAEPMSRIETKAGHVGVWGPSSFFTKRLLEAVGGVDVRFKYAMDNDLWHKFAYLEHQVYRVFCDYAWGLRLHEAAKMSGQNFDAAQKDPNHPRWKQIKHENELLWEVYKPKHGMTKWKRVLAVSWPKAIAGRIDSRRYKGRHYLEMFK